jgi:hypothetical protein
LKIAAASHSLGIDKSDLRFKYAASDAQGGVCSMVSLFPGVLGILWNDRSESLAGRSAEVRKALTQLIPRGELLNSGAKGMGELVSSFLPSQHPGYDRGAKIRPYSVESASKVFEQSGWVRSRAEGPRVESKTNQPVILTLALIGPASQGTELLQKVIGDSFALVGVKTSFIQAKSAAGLLNPSIDGTVGLFTSNWPAFNLLADQDSSPLSSLFSGSRIFADPEHQQLSKEYAVSLTSDSPDFGKLKQLHQKWFAAEVFSPVFQVGLCATRHGRTGAKINFTDPDWFRSLVL